VTVEEASQLSQVEQAEVFGFADGLLELLVGLDRCQIEDGSRDGGGRDAAFFRDFVWLQE
jgi:hypothetical protein